MLVQWCRNARLWCVQREGHQHAAAAPPPQALQEQKRDLMKVAFDRRKPEEVREMRLNDVRLLMDL